MDAEQARIAQVEAETDSGSRYLDMMYAAWKREFDLPTEYVCLCEKELDDGALAYWYADIRDLFIPEE